MSRIPEQMDIITPAQIRFFIARKPVCLVCSESVSLTTEPETALLVGPIINELIGNKII